MPGGVVAGGEVVSASVSAAEFVAACERAATAELAWLDPDGRPDAMACTPLVARGEMALALPLADSERARRLAEAGAAAMALTDSRLALRGWRPLVAHVGMTVTADPAGDWTDRGFLDQELRKQPPSRRLLDTPVLRREHWWYVPRWIVDVTRIDAARSLRRRDHPEQAVLAEARGSGLDVRPVSVADWDADPLRLRSLDGEPLEAQAAEAVVFTHDFTVPDRERSCAYTARGTLDGNRLRVRSRAGDRSVPPPPGLLRRLRSQGELARACKRELERLEREGTGSRRPRW